MSAESFYPRRPPRLDRLFKSAGEPAVFFVTCCTRRREPWLANRAVHDAFERFGRRAAEQFRVAVGRYVMMPDHLHFFVSGGPEFTLGRWVGQLKQALARACPAVRSGIAPWQDGFFDHLLRSEESLSQKWDYVRQNPVRAGLATRPEDWPYQGCIVEIDRV